MDIKQAAAAAVAVDKRRKSPNSAVIVDNGIEIHDSCDDVDSPTTAAAKRQKTGDAFTTSNVVANDGGVGTLFADAAAAAKELPLDDDDDDCIVVEAPEQEMTKYLTFSNASLESGTYDDEIEVVGCKNECRFSHFRQDCREKPFVPMSPQMANGTNIFFTTNNVANLFSEDDTNAETCDKCYCYICNMPANECQVCETKILFSNNVNRRSQYVSGTFFLFLNLCECFNFVPESDGVLPLLGYTAGLVQKAYWRLDKSGH
jgi:hypothetical protein